MKAEKKLMIHMYYGDPDVRFSQKLAQTILDSGADILEVGVPYTDPVCDGIVFQQACKRALAAGITPLQVFEGIKNLRSKGYTQPIYVTSYYGVIFAMGVDRFMAMVKDAGAQGVIVPDILLEEQNELLQAGEKYNVSVIQFATPYSTNERLKKILSVVLRHSENLNGILRRATPSSFAFRASKDKQDDDNSFLYCISLPSVTGAEKKQRNLTVLRRINKLNMEIPIFMGFGINTPSDAKEMIANGADGIIVGSAVARIYEKDLSVPEKSLVKIKKFIKSLKHSII